MGDSSSAQSVSITSGVDLDYTPCPPGLSQSQVRSRWSRGLPPDQEQELLQARQNQAVLIEQVDRSLGAVSVAAILFNRCIGSGIWNSPALVFYNTQSIGGSILMWLYGALTCMAGVVLYIELGLTVPRWRLPDGTKFSTPRSGAELVYLNYFFKIPKFFATCLYGVSFLFYGNTATNSVAFAIAALQSARAHMTAGRIIGVALGLNTGACLLHSMSRKWGILVNSVLGYSKLMMLLSIILIGFIYMDRSVSDTNFDSDTSFSRTPLTPSGVYRYAEALAFIIFPFGGFNQANYVLAEIPQPRRNFARTLSLTMGFLGVIYVVLNCIYAASIPRDILFQPDRDIPVEFFKHTVGRGKSLATLETVERACFALRAVSAVGNVIVFTFTAAKVKQEIAKEGIFPYSLHLASSYKFSFRHGFQRVPQHEDDHELISSKTPAAALLLHWSITTILIIVAVATTASASPDGTQIFLPGYSVLVMAYTYGLDLTWFTIIGINMVRLRLWPGSTWRNKSPIPHWLGVTAAIYFTLATGFPLLALWIPDLPAQPFLARSNERVPWFAGQATAVGILGLAFAYWLGYRFYLWQKKKRHGVERVVSRRPIFDEDETQGGTGGGVQVEGREMKLVLKYEIIEVGWKVWTPEEEGSRGQEYNRPLQPEMEEMGNGSGFEQRPQFRMPTRGF